MEYKYFDPDTVKQLADKSLPPEKAVELVVKHIEKTAKNATAAQMSTMMLEAQHIRKTLIAKCADSKEIRDRQTKLHNLYLNLKRDAAKERMMLLFTACNNAAYIVMMDALAKVKELPEYNARFSRLRSTFNHAEEEWQAYELRLKHSEHGWLDPKKFTPEQKKRFAADLTQEDYTEYWQCIGGKAYTKLTDEVNVLRNKFRLSIEAHGIPNAKTSAAVLATSSMLILCEAVHTKMVNAFHQKFSVTKEDAWVMWRDFSLKRMQLAWGKCVRMMGPVTMLNGHESRNLELTLEQLINHWNDEAFFRESLMETVEEFPEIFRTKGEQKKYLREILEDPTLN